MNAAHLEFCGGPVWQQMIEEMVMPTVMQGIDLGDDAIEIGPGPGFTTDVLRTQVGRLTAVEIDPDLAEKLRTRLVGSNVDVITCDASALELPDDRFSGAVSLNMLHHVPTDELQDRIFAELARVLRPGGTFIVSDAQPRSDLDAFHEGDTYHPIAPDDVPVRLGDAGFTDFEMGEYDLGWICSARAS